MKKCANDTTQVWYADDVSAGGTVSGVCTWREKLVEYGPQSGNFPKASKSSIIVKPGYEAKALEKFDDTDLIVTHEGRTHLGTTDYCNHCIRDKVQEWCKQVENLAKFAEFQPHAASPLLHMVS